MPTATAEVEVLTTPTASATIDPPVLKTSMGDFVINAVRLEDEVRGDKRLTGENFLLVSLTGADGAKLVAGEFSLEAFQKMVQEGGNEIYILASDRSQTFSTGMGGWLEDEFVMGF